MKSSFKRIILFLAVAVLLIIPDQYTKQLAVEYLQGGERITVIKNILYFLYVENRGAAFGVFQGAQYMFYIITIVVLFGILYAVYKTPLKDRHFYPMLLVAELVFAGAIGNFIDRVSQKYVVDFIYFSPIDFPVFNVADIYVTCGCIVMVLLFLFYYKDEDFAFLRPVKKENAVSSHSEATPEEK
ncbi:signal peptidase II [Oribacterium sp. WCC10]|uniref:signal peptidase II n=1 Tax=Oribacterium sp. WCC10 TaxID=1855343 RepID=UPI0008E16F11|nr:signal peptidase II [Oribacterium sp. WCC10]SFG08414.1 signal peptidase II [Oribacterium sp. WCC10]